MTQVVDVRDLCAWLLDAAQVGTPAPSIARAEIPLSVDIGPGGHEWSYWDARIQDVLEWLPLSGDAG